MLVGGEKGAWALVVSTLSTPHTTAHLRMFVLQLPLALAPQTRSWRNAIVGSPKILSASRFRH